MLRRECTHCEKMATIEMQGRFYCGEHALDKLRKTQEIPNQLKLVSPR